MPGYREEEGVASDSTTETFVAAKLYVDNWRWADMPFYVRAGKRLPRRETTIAIQFQRAPHPPFAEIAGDGLRPNVLLIHVQPDEGISLAIGAKVPGAGMSIRTVHMDFLYGGAFRTGLPEAYERLILDAMLGDATLFTRADEVDEQWALVDSIVAAWKRDRPIFPNYAARDVGPPSADDLIDRDGRELAAPLSDRRRRSSGARGAARSTAEGTRTSVMTHVAWAPPQWAARRADARRAEERHPSRTILLLPDPKRADGLDVHGRPACFELEGSSREVCSDVIELRLGGRRTRVPGSIVEPLLDPRPADVLPLARAAALGRAGARAARRRLRPARRRLVRMARPADVLREARAALRPDRRLGHRVGSWARLACASRGTVAGASRRRRRCRSRGRRRTRSCSRAGCDRG